MKQHTEEFKTQIKELGRQFRSQVTYGVKTLEEELYVVTPHYEGNILKSTMKQLDIETTENIPIMTQVNYKLGMLVGDEYEWLDFGNYVVYSNEKQEDKDTYKLVCYDKMLFSMIPYLGVNGTFPMTVREYINAVCTKLGLTFGSNTEEFANYDRVIPSDLYEGLEYTYRDVFDELAQVTASTICLNNDDEVVIRYINEGQENYNTIEGTNLVITDADSTKQASITEIRGKGKNLLNMQEYAEANSDYFTFSQETGLTAIAKDNRALANVQYPIEVTPNTNLKIITTTDKRILVSQWTATNTWIRNDEVFNNGSFSIASNTSYIKLKIADTLTVFPTVIGTVKILEGDVVTGDNNIVVSNKNIIPNNLETQTISGVTITKNEDGSLLLNGTSTATIRINLAENYNIEQGSYIWSINKEGTISSTAFISLLTTGTTTELSGSAINLSTQNIKSFTISGTTNVYARLYIGSGRTFTNFKIYPMLEKGTTATSYIAHQGNSYRVDLGGKNIFNIEQAITRMENNAGTLVNNWGTYEDGILTMNRSMGYHGTTCFAGQKFNLEANKTYTLSAIVYLTGTNATSNVILGFAGESNPNVTITKEVWTKVSRTVSFTEYKENMRVFIQPSNTGNVLQMKEIMLCEGTDTTYSPYTSSPIELTEQDKLWNNNGTWQLNDTAITDTYLLSQLQALDNIELYDELSYVDFVGNVKADMRLTYYLGRDTEELNEEYLKDINVDFGEKYGPINSIVLSRAAETDNVYLQDEDSIAENGLCELKIIDNQIMNFNDRSDYLVDILEKLDGLEYYINDYTSTGIGYLELCDRYYVSIRGQRYSCIMFNDELDITSGVQELIHTDMPQETQTDYTKADKTDRRINQTYIIVDKQNQKIESLTSEVDEFDDRVSTLTQTVEEIEAKVEDIADVTRYAESNFASVSIEKVNTSEPVLIKVRPTQTPGISYLYPRENLYPSDTLFMTERKIRFKRTYEEDGQTKVENIDYELPTDLLYYNSTTYDEFILDYVNKECKVIKMCKYKADGTVEPLNATQTITYDYPTIELWNGDYEVSILGYDFGYIYARLMIQNEYTTQFTTEVQARSSLEIKEREILGRVSQEYETKGEAATQYAEIKVTTDGISSEVANKVGNDEVVSKINQSAEAVSIQANKININGVISANGNFKVDTNGNMECNNAKMNGGNVALYGGTVNNPNLVIYDEANNTEGGRALFTSSRLRMYPKYSKDNHIEMKMQFVDNNNYGTQPYAGFDLYHGSDQAILQLTNSGGANVSVSASGSAGTIVNNGPMYATAYNNYSKESIKKNFEKINNATDILKNAEIYEYNYKNEKDSDRKHIGFVIADEGGNFKTPKEVMSKEEDAIDMYSMCSILWKAVQEQQEKIEELENKLKEEK